MSEQKMGFMFENTPLPRAIIIEFVSLNYSVDCYIVYKKKKKKKKKKIVAI